MIGQREVITKIFGQIERGKFPRFSILIGESGGGKKTLAKEISNKLGVSSVIIGTTVDNIRGCIEDSYKLVDPMVYIIADCDNMSSAAANALLKVTEEPPQQAYFILTCENLENLLPTIKSRGVTYMLEPYSYEDKCDYLSVCSKQLSEEDETFILDVATNIGDLKMFMDIDVAEFRNYVILVIDNIAKVQGSNAFKIGDKISLKEDNKYDLRLFWKAFICLCVDRMVGEDAIKYAVAVAMTGNALQQLSIKGINKDMLFSTWVLDIRSEWL